MVVVILMPIFFNVLNHVYKINSIQTGFLYCIGGITDEGSTAACSYYDETNTEWKEISPMPTARCGMAAVAFRGRIYALGE